MVEKKKRGGQRKNQEARKSASVRLRPALARSLALYAANHSKSVGQLLVEVTEDWWQSRPDRAKYEKLQEAK